MNLVNADDDNENEMSVTAMTASQVLKNYHACATLCLSLLTIISLVGNASTD